MERYTVDLDPCVAEFFRKIAGIARKPTEQVLADALYRLAGALSADALLHRK